MAFAGCFRRARRAVVGGLSAQLAYALCSADDPRKEHRPGQFNAGVELSAFYQLPPAGPVRSIRHYLK